MPNAMVALRNIGGALCSTTQSLAYAHTRVPWSNAAKTRNPLTFAGVTQTCQQISAVSRPKSIPYYQDMWRSYCCLTSFFLIVDTCLSSEDIARQSCAMVPKWRFFCVLYFSASRMQHISDMHSKFTLRPHHVWRYGTIQYNIKTRNAPYVTRMLIVGAVDIQPPTAEIRRGKKIEEERNHRAKYNGLPYSIGRP